jgi:hypothetical protein
VVGTSPLWSSGLTGLPARSSSQLWATGAAASAGSTAMNPMLSSGPSPRAWPVIALTGRALRHALEQHVNGTPT